MDDRGQLWLGGLGNSGTLIDLLPSMAATVLGEEDREEAVAQEEVGRCGVADVLLPNVVRRGAIQELSRLLSGGQTAPLLPKLDVGFFVLEINGR